MGRYCPRFGDIYRCNSDCTSLEKRIISRVCTSKDSGDDAIEQKESRGYDTLACNRKLTKTNHEQELLKFDVNFLY